MSGITSPRSSRRRRRGSGAPLAATAVLGVAIAIAALAVVSRPDTGGLQPTGARNAMGMPIVTTPGEATGTASAGGIEVDGATWAMGEVPLDVAVQPAWTLRNTSGEDVVLGGPHAEVRAGCCPGPFEMGSSTLAPGESTTLTFDLAMHEGMDGWHDFAVHVPVGEEVLTLDVTGDFRG